MIIDIHLGLFQFCIFKGVLGQRFESRPVQGFKQDCAGGVELVEFSVVKLGQFFRNGRVEFGQAEEFVAGGTLF